MTSAPPALTPRHLIHVLWLGPIAIVFLAAFVLIAIIVRDFPAVREFIEQFPGQSELPAGAPVGIPAWLGWQHFLSSFFLLLILRTGWTIRTTTRPEVFWTRNNEGLVRTKYPPTRLSLAAWLHLSIDVLWVLNGVVFIVLIFVTGQWVRIVPTSWDIIPNAVSTAIQYASLDWPTENGWVNYNALQVLAYFATVFIAAPLAIVSGIRLSPLWSQRMAPVNRFYPVKWARAVHYPVMLYFVLFTIAHVGLVFATGALRNLNHMYASRDDGGWLGFIIFAGSVVLMIAVWLLARPSILKPIASLTGTVSEGRQRRLPNSTGAST